MLDRTQLVRRALVAVLAVAIPAIAASCSGANGDHGRITVNGRQVPLKSKTWDVEDAIKSVGSLPRAGMVRAAVTGNLLAPNGNPAVVQLDGTAVPVTAKVKSGASITASNGADTNEPVQERVAYGDPPPLPDVMTNLWHPGRGPVERQTVGTMSGEVVTRTALGPAVPPQPEAGKVIALSFDDGPDPRYTPQILAILKAEGVKAMFCLVGYSAKKYPDLVAAELAAGHTLCNHTMNHAHMPKLSPSDMADQITNNDEVIKSAVSQTPVFFRAPYGELSPAVVQAVHDQHEQIVQWNIDPSDFRKPPASAILARVLASLKPGAVVLMHDGGGERDQTVAALKPLINALKAQGWTFATPATEPPVSGTP